MRASRDLFRDEHGVTTTSMVLALLITLSLLFTAAQVYRINSFSADTQDVADAVSLAAESQVAELMVVAQFCDAVVLSLTLTSLVTTSLGIAAACTPATATASTKLIDAGKKIVDVRNKFSDRATKALNKLQQALPFYAAACSAAIAQANNATTAGANYLGTGILIPTKGEELEVTSNEKEEELMDDVDEKTDDVREDAKKAEEAAKEANKHKQTAFDHDCGDYPKHCMYERARKLAGMQGVSNPLYNSVDTWSFSVALSRAQSYYQQRKNNEGPANDTTAEKARSALRYRFYSYACATLSQGYVHETSDSFTANFPRLPKNTSEMRSTSLYTENAYPISEEKVPPASKDEKPTYKLVMHAFSGCPGATGKSKGLGSISYMESQKLDTCPICGFTAASLGKVAAATSSVSSGFEYHYNVVANAADEYEKASKKAKKQNKKVKNQVNELFGELKDALKEAAGKRIEMSPPGKFGAVALVVNVGTTPASSLFENGFVSATGSLGPRAAISASTLVEESSDEGRTVINSILDGLREDGGILVGAAGIVLDVWSWMLLAYSNGQNAITGGIESGLNALPLVGPSGLGTWVADKLKDLIKSVGLQPVKMKSLKPVLVNTAHIAAKEGSSVSSGLLSMKQRIVSHPQAATDLFSAVLTDAERAALERVDNLGDSIEIASIELLGSDGPSIPITIPIPDVVKEQGKSKIQEMLGRIRSQHVETMEVKPWE